MQARGNSSGRAARSRWLLLAAPALLLLAVTISQSDTDSARTLSKLPNAVQQQLVGAWGARDQRGIYGAPGWLAVDRTIKPIHRRARWVPLDRLQDLAQLGLTGLETDYQLDDGYDLLSQYRNALGPTNNTQALSEIPNLSFLRDKTILLIGDSQDRYLTDVACEDHLQGTLTYRDFWWRQDGEHSLSEVVAGKKYRTIALHHCQLPSSLGNTSIWSSTTYGSVTEEDTFGKMYPNFPEKALEARIRRLGQAFRNEGLRPDLIIAHTMLWDLSAMNLMDANANLPASSSISVGHMQKFKQRLLESLAHLQEEFPTSVKMYRMLHEVRVTQGSWVYRYADEGVKEIPRTPYMNNKIAQLNTIVRSVIPNQKVIPFELGRVLSGYLQDHRDDQHFGKIGAALYLQMLLYYMKRLT